MVNYIVMDMEGAGCRGILGRSNPAVKGMVCPGGGRPYGYGLVVRVGFYLSILRAIHDIGYRVGGNRDRCISPAAANDNIAIEHGVGAGPIPTGEGIGTVRVAIRITGIQGHAARIGGVHRILRACDVLLRGGANRTYHISILIVEGKVGQTRPQVANGMVVGEVGNNDGAVARNHNGADHNLVRGIALTVNGGRCNRRHVRTIGHSDYIILRGLGAIAVLILDGQGALLGCNGQEAVQVPSHGVVAGVVVCPALRFQILPSHHIGIVQLNALGDIRIDVMQLYAWQIGNNAILPGQFSARCIIVRIRQNARGHSYFTNGIPITIV